MKRVRTHPSKRTMTVEKLRDLLSGFPPEALVVIEGGPDHTFNSVLGLRDDTAGYDGQMFFEWAGEEHASEDEEPLRVAVIE
jgi:hypothetical protein